MPDLEKVAALHAEAVDHHEAGNDRQALRLLSRARRETGRSAAVAQTRAVLYLDEGNIHAKRERFRRAEACYRRAAGTIPPGDASAAPLRFDVLQHLGDVHRVLGHFDDADATLRQALAEAERMFGPDSLEVATQLNNLGVLEKARSRPGDAVRYYYRSLAIVERVLGPGSGEVATIMHNLGGIAHAQGEFALGEPYARKAVVIREAALGADHPEVAADRAALAAIVDALGRHAEAEALYREALAVFERVLGPEHYEVGSTLRSLAVIRERAGDVDTAERYYRSALAIKRKVLGTQHPEVATLLHDLALLSFERGRDRLATSLMTRARTMFDGTLPADHPTRTRSATSELALREAIASRARASA